MTVKPKKDKANLVEWIENVKYRGKRYRAGESAEINEEDRDELIADGVIRAEDE
ncbi:DUF7210 family protein [Paenibacillus selenitireducens]|uniref:DUF7210 family protein n=1 Tax=Paenibacillus selenitireducens TaxID=1324314 RepID=UPI00130209FB|nr:hypothetical protein [Paenibacillus selenitireducens]